MPIISFVPNPPDRSKITAKRALGVAFMRIRSNRTAVFAAVAASFIVLVLDAKPTQGQGLVTALDDVLAINKGKQAQLAARQKAGASTALGPLSPGGLAIPATTLGGPAMVSGGSISAFRQSQAGGVLAAASGYNTAPRRGSSRTDRA